jgi:hypothetical protein
MIFKQDLEKVMVVFLFSLLVFSSPSSDVLTGPLTSSSFHVFGSPSILQLFSHSSIQGG